MMNHTPLSVYLRRIDASGPLGFEGLIAQLLEKLTGLNFRLAKAGYQAGRDLGSRDWEANVITVEAKKYGTTALKERELIGEVSQANWETPDLDLWVLATSREVDTLLVERLTRACQERGFEFLHLSTDEGGTGTLDTLCAIDPELVLQYLRKHTSPDERQDIQHQLEGIKGSKQFNEQSTRLRRQLLSPFTGFASWARHQRILFLKHLQSEEESRVAFGQILNVADDDVRFVHRYDAWREYDSWLAAWGQKRQPLVVLGDAGHGKTWSVAAWLKERTENQEDFSPVLFVPSFDAVSQSELREIILKRMSGYHNMLSKEQAESRLNRWLTGAPRSNSPLLIAVLDGINEKGSPRDWLALFEEAALGMMRSRIGIIVTCRTGFWERNFADLAPSVHTYTQGPFSERELVDALAFHNLSHTDISGDLFPLIRNPRYFDLMVRHREKMAQSGDITVARLIYEDWRDRVRRKRNLSDLPHQDFQNLIRDLSAQHLNRVQGMRDREIGELLPVGVDANDILSELKTGGILVEVGSRFRVDSAYLVYGFGLLLVDELETAWAKKQSQQDLREALADTLEPHEDMDLKAEICAFAALHALRVQATLEIRVVLLEAWIRNRNAPDSAERDFIAYIPLDPRAYFELAEECWQAHVDNRWVQELLLKGFLRWSENADIQRSLESITEKWLGFVHPHGFSYQRGKDGSRALQIHEEIERRIGQPLTPGPLAFAGYQLTVIEDDGLLRLGNFALALISHLSRKRFFRALVTGIVAEAVMGFWATRDNLYQWIFTTATEPLWEVVEQETLQLLAFEMQATRQAARRLLAYEAGQPAMQMRGTITVAEHQPNLLLQRHREDPCSSGLAWNEEQQSECVKRADVPAWRKANNVGYRLLDPTFHIPQIFKAQVIDALNQVDPNEFKSRPATTSADLEVEVFEPVLCRVALPEFSTFIRDVVGDLRERQGIAVQSLGQSLTGHTLLFHGTEYEAVYQAWIATSPDSPPSDKQNEANELFLFEHVLEALDGKQQLIHMLHRHPERHDLIQHLIRLRPSKRKTGHIVTALPLIEDKDNLRRVIHFLLVHVEELKTEEIEQYWLPMLEHEDSFIRSLILKGLYYSHRNEVVERYLDRQDWTWRPSFHELENEWGSQLLAKYGQQLALSDLYSRVHPAFWGDVAFYRGTDEQQVRRLVEMYHGLLETIDSRSSDVPHNLPAASVSALLDREEDTGVMHRVRVSRRDVSTSFTFYSPHSSWGGLLGDFSAHDDALEESLSAEWYAARWETLERVRQAQLATDNPLLFTRVSSRSLDAIVRQHPEFVEQWLATIFQNTHSASQLLLRAQAFFQTLCEVLLQEAPEKGIALYWHLSSQQRLTHYIDARTGISLLDGALFNAPAIETVRQTWRLKFESCQTDLELFEFAVAAQVGTAHQWLREWVEAGLGASSSRAFSRAVTLLGMLDSSRYDELIVLQGKTTSHSWRAEAIKVALERCRRNGFAKHWFSLFFQAESNEQAWGAFQLFLHCVDSRYWLWHEEFVEGESKRNRESERIRFLHNNIEDIRNRIKRNENKLFKDKLFGQKVIQRQVWPWI